MSTTSELVCFLRGLLISFLRGERGRGQFASSSVGIGSPTILTEALSDGVDAKKYVTIKSVDPAIARVRPALLNKITYTV